MEKSHFRCTSFWGAGHEYCPLLPIVSTHLCSLAAFPVHRRVLTRYPSDLVRKLSSIDSGLFTRRCYWEWPNLVSSRSCFSRSRILRRLEVTFNAGDPFTTSKSATFLLTKLRAATDTATPSVQGIITAPQPTSACLFSTISPFVT